MDTEGDISARRQAIMSELRSLLSEALDDVPDDVAIKAAVAFIHFARTQQITVNQIMALHTVVAPRQAAQPRPEDYQQQPPKESIELTPMPFGKHKGVPLFALVEREPDYCHWLLENVPKLAPSLRVYFTTKLTAPAGG